MIYIYKLHKPYSSVESSLSFLFFSGFDAMTALDLPRVEWGWKQTDGRKRENEHISFDDERFATRNHDRHSIGSTPRSALHSPMPCLGRVDIDWLIENSQTVIVEYRSCYIDVQ